MFEGLSDKEVAKTGKTDTGYCNHPRMKQAVDARNAAIQELTRRGRTQEEAEYLIDQ